LSLLRSSDGSVYYLLDLILRFVLLILHLCLLRIGIWLFFNLGALGHELSLVPLFVDFLRENNASSLELALGDLLSLGILEGFPLLLKYLL
jgi:hypothetical protein